MCMTGIHASKRRKEMACLESGWGWGVGVGGDICDFSRASQICSLLFCTCFAAEQYPLFIKEIFLFHTSLSLHISLISGRKKKKNQPGRISLFWSCDCFQQDGQMYQHSACLPEHSGRKTKEKGLGLTYSAHIDVGRRERQPANEETRGKSCRWRVYSSVNLQGRTDIL